MSNTTLTADIIAKEAVMILENNCVMANLVHRGYENEFDKKPNGYKVGEAVSIRRPTDFTVRDGRVADIQDVVEGKTTVTVDKQKGIDFKFTSEDLTLQIGALSERVIKPAMIQLANQIDTDVMGLYNEVPRHVTLPSGGMDSFADFSLAPKLMDNCSIPQEGRNAVLSPDNHWELLGSQTGLYIQDAARGAYRSARLGMVGGVDTYMSQNVPTHTTGTRTGTDLTDQALTATTHTWATYKDATTATVHFDNVVSGSTFKKGDILEIDGAWDVNPVSKARLGHLKQFVVMADATFTATTEGDLSIWPPLIGSGAQKNVDFGESDLNSNTVTYQGTASTNFPQSLFFHKNAFALTMVPMVSPPGAVDVGRRSYKGISVRVIPYFDGINDVSNWRLDVLYGVDCIDPRMAVRASLMADVA
jgi:hypothetical protein